MAYIILAIVALWGVAVGIMSHIIASRGTLPKLFIKAAGGILLLMVTLGMVTADISSTTSQKIIFIGTIFTGMIMGHFLASIVHKRRLQKGR